MSNNKYPKKDEMNASVLSTQDSNGQKKKDSLTSTGKNKYDDQKSREEKYREDKYR